MNNNNSRPRYITLKERLDEAFNQNVDLNESKADKIKYMCDTFEKAHQKYEPNFSYRIVTLKGIDYIDVYWSNDNENQVSFNGDKYVFENTKYSVSNISKMFKDIEKWLDVNDGCEW